MTKKQLEKKFAQLLEHMVNGDYLCQCDTDRCVKYDMKTGTWKNKDGYHTGFSLCMFTSGHYKPEEKKKK